MIYYRNDVRRSGVDGRALVATAKRLLGAIGRTRPSLSLTLVGDDAMRELNRDAPRQGCADRRAELPARRRERTAASAEPERLLGDVVISVDTARRQAADYDAPLQRELYRLLIHGLLHLMGHDHVRAG